MPIKVLYFLCQHCFRSFDTEKECEEHEKFCGNPVKWTYEGPPVEARYQT
jgi:hypothetical protein